MPPRLNRRRALFVLAKIDEILAWEQRRETERDTKFVELGRYLCEVRAGQYWRLESLNSFDAFLGCPARQAFFPVNDNKISRFRLKETSSSRGCGKSGNPAAFAGFPRAVGREENLHLVFLAFHGPGFSIAHWPLHFCY
jgi:hypothetical protein